MQLVVTFKAMTGSGGPPGGVWILLYRPHNPAPADGLRGACVAGSGMVTESLTSPERVTATNCSRADPQPAPKNARCRMPVRLSPAPGRSAQVSSVRVIAPP